MTEAIPNLLMLQYLTVCENGGTVNLDKEELAIAIAVGIENNWLVDATTLTSLGRSFCQKGVAIPEFIPNPQTHPIFQCVKDELGTFDIRNRRQKFEIKYKLPARSARLLQRIIRETEN